MFSRIKYYGLSCGFVKAFLNSYLLSTQNTK